MSNDELRPLIKHEAHQGHEEIICFSEERLAFLVSFVVHIELIEILKSDFVFRI